MKILVCADRKQEEEIRMLPFQDGAEVDITTFQTSPDWGSYEVIFFLDHLPEKEMMTELKSKAVFINDVMGSYRNPAFGRNLIRMNGWPGFLKRSVWEGTGEANDFALRAIETMGRTWIQCSDIPGLISGRIIASIINEAYAALHENISSKEEIDMAMKYGTHYPYGPFEWAQKIGEKRIYSLLLRMAEEDPRYTPLFTPSNSVE